MKYFIASFLFLMAGQFAFAGQGNDQARMLCTKISKNKKRIKCNSLTENKFFDANAVSLCSSLLNTRVILECLRTVSGYKYKNPTAVGHCSTRPTDSKKIKCISKISDRKLKVYRPNRLKSNAGTNSAFELCGSHLRNSDKTACLKLVRGKKFNANAVNICRNLIYTSDKNKCMGIIGNQEYSATEIDICGKMTYTSDKLKCLKHDDSAKNSANPIVSSQSSSYDSALNVCANFMYASDKNNCLNKVRGKKFSAGTVEICANLMYVADKLKCLDTIANNSYHPTELKVCSGMMYTAEKLKCLKGAATGNIHARPKGRSNVELVEDALGFMRSGKTKRAKKLLKKAWSRM